MLGEFVMTHWKALSIVVTALSFAACQTTSPPELNTSTAPAYLSSPLPTHSASPDILNSPSPSVPVTVGKPVNTRCTADAADTNMYLLLGPSRQTGWCMLVLPLEGYRIVGYSLIYPDTWSVRLAGVEAMNLLFNEGESDATKPLLLVQLTTSDLPLEQADAAVYGYEMSGPEPLVKATEVVISKTVVQLGGVHPTLILDTQEGSTYIRRYFLTSPAANPKEAISGTNGVYVFRMSTSQANIATPSWQSFVHTVEAMILSFKLLQ